MHNNLHSIQVNKELLTWNYLTQKVMSSQTLKYFKGNNINLFFKNKHIFEETYCLFGNNFQ